MLLLFIGPSYTGAQSLGPSLSDKLMFLRLNCCDSVETEFSFFLAVEVSQVLDSILWVRCASGNVYLFNALLRDSHTNLRLLKVQLQI